MSKPCSGERTEGEALQLTGPLLTLAVVTVTVLTGQFILAKWGPKE